MAQGTYLVAELAIVSMILLVKPSHVSWRVFWSRHFIVTATGLFFFWLALDLVALAIGLWYFPPERNVFIQDLRPAT